MDTIFRVQHPIQSLEEIVHLVPAGTTCIECTGKGLTSLKGIHLLPSVTKLVVNKNRLTDLEGLSGSNVTKFYAYGNRFTSLKGLSGSNVTILDFGDNQLASLEGLAGSSVTRLFVEHNRLASLEGLAGSDVITLYIGGNPCEQEFLTKFEGSVQKFKEHYMDPLDVKCPEFD